jgi:hypothetical protein
MHEESNRTHDVFLSYSSKDKTWADAACAVLERHRVRCWIAPRDITPGDEWGAAIMKGLNGSRIMVLIFSGHANASEQVRREVERAISQGMTVLPVRVEDVRPDGAMEFALGNRHWLDAFTPPVERQLELLTRSVKTLLGNEPAKTEAIPPIGPADAIQLRPRRAFWPIAIAASLFGLVVLGVVMIAIKTRNGETKTTVAGDSSNQVGVDRKILEHDAPKTGPATIANTAADSAGPTPSVSNASPTRIPPAGPARVAQNNAGEWTVDGDQLVKEGMGRGEVVFGDQGWTDYDLTFEARQTAGAGLGAIFRERDGKHYSLTLGGIDKKHYLRSRSHDKVTDIQSQPGRVQPLDWYKLKISLRGPRIRIELEGHLLFDCTDKFTQRGAVGLHFINSAGQFRSIKVAAPDGTVLWEGPPELPGK